MNKGSNETSVQFKLLFASTKTAEIFNAYKKNIDRCSEELADTAIYLPEMAETKGINPKKEIKRKVSINENRNYPKK